MAEAKYVTCLKCGHMETWLSHSLLKASVGCPECGTKDQFGPGIYIDEFKGYGLKTALRMRLEKAPNAPTQTDKGVDHG